MNGRFEGIIQKVNKPKFINKHTVWSISLKENGKWTSVWRKDQSKADELYRLLVKRMKSNGLGIDLKPTTLSQKQLEISQLCFNRLEANEFLRMDDDSTATKMLSAVDFFIQHYYEHEVPKGQRCCANVLREAGAAQSVRIHTQRLSQRPFIVCRRIR